MTLAWARGVPCAVVSVTIVSSARQLFHIRVELYTVCGWTYVP
jgi:hypothetical protein